MNTSSKDPVRLRKRTLSSGLTSLYLDIYVDGRRRYEYLKLYLVPERNRDDKAMNKQTMQLAEAIRAKRIVEVQNGKFGFEGEREQITFLDYYKAQAEKRHGKDASRGNWGNWWSTLQHLERYCREDELLEDIDKKWLEGWIDYLKNTARVRDKRKHTNTAHDLAPLSKNTIHSYYAKVAATINKAHEEGLITLNPVKLVEIPKEEETERVYLTIDEVKAMAQTECLYPALKAAFMFSCLTGIRKSDIQKMRWGEVVRQGEFTRIIFKQQKTGGQMYLDISDQAVRYMGERRGDDEKVFAGFYYSSYVNVELRRWAMRAGITKEVTFHTGRHTFAVMMLDLGADIYTVKELLGHKEIHTTQIYAKVLDKSKQNAVMKIPKIDIED